MPLSLYSTYREWRRDVAAEKTEAAARRVITPSFVDLALGRLGLARTGRDAPPVGIG